MKLTQKREDLEDTNNIINGMDLTESSVSHKQKIHIHFKHMKPSQKLATTGFKDNLNRFSKQKSHRAPSLNTIP